MENINNKGGRKESPQQNQCEQEVKKNSDEVLQLVSFTLGDEEFGVEILKVQEINRVMEITKALYDVWTIHHWLDTRLSLRIRILFHNISPSINKLPKYTKQMRESLKSAFTKEFTAS